MLVFLLISFFSKLSCAPVPSAGSNVLHWRRGTEAKQGGAILTYRGPTVDVESWWSDSSLASGKAQGRWRMDMVHRGTCRGRRLGGGAARGMPRRRSSSSPTPGQRQAMEHDGEEPLQPVRSSYTRI
jgi:hypothetical protein